MGFTIDFIKYEPDIITNSNIARPTVIAPNTDQKIVLSIDFKETMYLIAPIYSPFVL